MREILFRGKCLGRLHKKGFVYGSLGVIDTDLVAIYQCKEFTEDVKFIVDIGTIGQYTGLTDKNGTKIFEGDIVKNDWCFLRGYSVIKFGQYKPFDMSNDYQQGHLGFYLEHIHKVDKNTARKDIMYFANKCEVIGNIHDNPELLKECEG